MQQLPVWIIPTQGIFDAGVNDIAYCEVKVIRYGELAAQMFLMGRLKIKLDKWKYDSENLAYSLNIHYRPHECLNG